MSNLDLYNEIVFDADGKIITQDDDYVLIGVAAESIYGECDILIADLYSMDHDALQCNRIGEIVFSQSCKKYKVLLTRSASQNLNQCGFQDLEVACDNLWAMREKANEIKKSNS